jgi:hypothetical protein
MNFGAYCLLKTGHREEVHIRRRSLVLQEVGLPQQLQLQHDCSRIVGTVEVVWRKENRVGVRFCTRAKASP